MENFYADDYHQDEAARYSHCKDCKREPLSTTDRARIPSSLTRVLPGTDENRFISMRNICSKCFAEKYENKYCAISYKWDFGQMLPKRGEKMCTFDRLCDIKYAKTGEGHRVRPDVRTFLRISDSDSRRYRIPSKNNQLLELLQGKYIQRPILVWIDVLNSCGGRQWKPEGVEAVFSQAEAVICFLNNEDNYTGRMTKKEILDRWIASKREDVPGSDKSLFCKDERRYAGDHKLNFRLASGFWATQGQVPY